MVLRALQEAKRLVGILRSRGCPPDVDIETREAVSWFIEEGLDERQCFVGLAQAAVEGWVVAQRFGTIRLTAAGIWRRRGRA
jgi:hypothetical protein